MIYFLFKKPGIFSTKSYLDIKIRNKKCGHAGTLDLFAKGLMIVATNEDTKKLTEFSLGNKGYYFECVWGIETETNDVYGKTILKNIKEINIDQIYKTIAKILTSDYYQIPPKKCAKSINGKKMYKMDFTKISDKDLFFKRKLVKINEIRVLSHVGMLTSFYIECTHGFYIRAFVRDLSYELRTVASAMNIFRIFINDVNISSINFYL